MLKGVVRIVCPPCDHDDRSPREGLRKASPASPAEGAAEIVCYIAVQSVTFLGSAVTIFYLFGTNLWSWPVNLSSVAILGRMKNAQGRKLEVADFY